MVAIVKYLNRNVIRILENNVYYEVWRYLSFLLGRILGHASTRSYSLMQYLRLS